MLTNASLQFSHRFNLEIFHDSEDPSLEIAINDNIVYKKTFAMNQVHIITPEFEFNYHDKIRNELCFKFIGKKETANRFLKIKSIVVNGVYVDPLLHYYFPKLDQDWLAGLTREQKQIVDQKVHGNNGGQFGWFGDIKYYYSTGEDFNSRYQGNNDPIALFKKPLWITRNTNTINNPWEKLDD